jgi:hypothetical protein
LFNTSVPIIPQKQEFYLRDSNKILAWETNKQYSLDYHAIATFCSLGFMLEDDTYYNDVKVLKPATKYIVDENNIIVDEKKIWQWHYSPRNRTLSKILEEFEAIFEKIINDSTRNKSILLPISSGLDSRSLFVPIRKNKNLTLTSYEFEGGFSESETGQKLSEHYNIPLFSQKIQRGYLWNKINEFHELNSCFTDFTHPRQVDAINNWKGLGDVILLGHWGDVLFDKQAVSENISYNEQVSKLKKKIIKPGGMELAHDLWEHWGIEDSFESYITERLDRLYRNIDIDHPSARMRAFKSLHWAPRWTSINLSIFKRAGEIILPYYSDEMCKFICTIPENYLKGRKIQIEYIKKHCPEAARIPWQQCYPLNLYQYQQFNHLAYYPVRAINKVKRVLQRELFNSAKLITRNWELQFLGAQNIIQLKNNLLGKNKFNKLIPQTIIRKYLDKFQTDPVQYAHPLSMLLTLAVFSDKHYSE